LLLEWVPGIFQKVVQGPVGSLAFTIQSLAKGMTLFFRTRNEINQANKQKLETGVLLQSVFQEAKYCHLGNSSDTAKILI
jgi:hypothetical protein